MLTSLVASLLLSIQGSPDLEKKLDFKGSVLFLDTFAEQLSKESGVRMVVTPDISGISVYANVRGKSVRELLDMVAYATTTEWVFAEGRVTIRRTPVQVADEAARFQAHRVANAELSLAQGHRGPVTLEAMLSAVKSALELSKKIGSRWDMREYERMRIVDRIAPGQVIARTFADSVGLETLAALDPMDRVVYSTRPTGLQRALPASMKDAVADLNKYLAMAKQAREIAQVPEDYGDYYSELLTDRRSLYDGKELDAASDMHVIVAQGQIRVIAYSARGEMVNESTLPFSMQARRDGAKSFFDTGDKVILSEDMTEKGKVLRKMIQSKLSGDERELVLRSLAQRQLLQNSPSALSVVLDRWAEKNGGLVLEAPNLFQPVGGREISPSDVLTRVLDDRAIERSAIHHVTVARVLSAESRVPRLEDPASIMAERLLTSGELTFEDWADIAAESESDEVFEHVRQLGDSLNASPHVESEGGFGSRMMRIYGRLPKATRQQVREGGREWTLNTLPASIRELVIQTIMEGAFAPGAGISESDRSWHEEGIAPVKIPLSEYEEEPTVLLTLPKAQPGVFRLEFLIRPRILVETTDSRGRRTVSLARIDQLGRDLALAELRHRNDPAGSPLSERAYAQVEKGELRAKLSFSAGFPGLIGFPVVMDREVSFGPLTSLPKETLAVIDAEYRKALKQYENTDFVRPGGNSNPPPP